MNTIPKPAKFKVSLKILLLNNDNKCLLLKTPITDAFKGAWDLPGGKINEDEINLKIHELVDREIKEELGSKVQYQLRPDPVALSLFRFDDRKDDEDRFWVLFEAKYISGSITLSNEHEEYRWEDLYGPKIKQDVHTSLKKLITNYFTWNK